MSGTQEGGKQAAQQNKEKFGSDFYKRIGSIGGKKSRGGGFTSETAKRWGKIGGRTSKRRPTK